MKNDLNIKAFPCIGDSINQIYPQEGMTLLDFFAGQYMSFGMCVETAYLNADLALKERQKYIK